MNKPDFVKRPRSHLGALLIAAAVVLTGCFGHDSPAALLDKARSALAAGDARTAEIHLKNLLQQEDSAEGRALLGEMYRRAGNFLAAEKEFRRALELGADRTRVLPQLLDALVQTRQFQPALDAGRDLALADPAAQATALTTLARAYAGLGDTTQTRARLEQALVADPNHVAAKIGLVMLDAARDRVAALARIDEILAAAPESVEALTAKGDLELANGHFAAARAPLEKVAAKQSDNASVRAMLTSIELELNDVAAARKRWADLERIAPKSPGTYYLRAQIELRDNQLGEARRAVEDLLHIAPEFLPGVALAGNIYLGLNLFEQAESNARKVIERAPKAAQGYRLLGATLLRNNAPERALEAVRPALERGIKDATLYGIAGEAALRVNDVAKADEYFAAAAKLAPQDPRKRTGLALSKLAAGDKAEGYAELEEAVKLDSQSHRADLALVLARLRDRDYDKALTAIDALVAKVPDSPLPLNLRGMALAGKRDTTGARGAFESALAKDQTFFPAVANLAALDMAEKHPEEARKRFEEVLKKSPNHVQALLALARLNAATDGARKDTLALLERARSGNPGELAPVLALADFHLQGDAPREAVPLLQAGLATHAGNAALLDRLGTAYLRMGDNAQAISTFEQILKANPISAPLQMRMGEVRVSLKDDAGAAQNFRKAAELSPKAGEPWAALVMTLQRMGKTDEAKATAAAMHRELPDHPLALAIDGDLEAAQQHWPQAAAAYRKALAKSPQSLLVVRLHQALRRTGKGDEAAAVLTAWFAKNPDDVAMRLYAGDQEIAQKHWKEASGHYQRVIARQPTNVGALNNLAWALSQLKDPAALTYAEKAAALAPRAAPVIDTLGTVLSAAGQHARAIETMRQAVALAPKSNQFRLHLAEALAAGGDKAGAKKEVETVLKDVAPGPLADEAKALAAKL